MKSLDIAVCGCGPAGLAAALLLRRAGHRVRIFERFDSARPVGSGLILQPTGLGVLEELGLVPEALSLGARIDRLFGRVVPSNRVVLDVRYAAMGPAWQGVAIHRASLFGILHRAAVAAGIDITPAVDIARVERDESRATLFSKSDVRLGDFDLVVDALGARSPLSSGMVRRKVLPYGALWVNVPLPAKPFDAHALEQRYVRASRMAGVLPIGRTTAEGAPLAAFFWSLRRDQFDAWRARPLEAWKQEVAQVWPDAAAAIQHLGAHEELVFAQYDHFTARSPVSHRLVHIGDAARSTSPQLGQGANMALLDALALARALQLPLELPAQLRRYARMRYWHVRLFQGASAMFTPFYQSDSRLLPWVRDWLAAPLSRLPVGDALLARLVSGMTVAPIASSDFRPYSSRSQPTPNLPGLEYR